MIEQRSETSHTYSGLSRRDFHKFLLVGLGTGSTIVSPITLFFVDQYMSTKLSREIPPLLDAKQQTLLEEIKQYRAAFQLPELPDYLSEANLQLASGIRWDTQPEPVQFDLPAGHQSQGMRVAEIEKILFGDNAPRLVRTIGVDYDIDAGGNFYQEARSIRLDINAEPYNPRFTNSIVHEHIHAADPYFFLAHYYPVDTLLRVSHGMARVFRQANTIDGKFLNDPLAYNTPYIKKQLGKAIGLLFTENKLLADVTDVEGHRIILSVLQQIANVQNTSIEQILFTKRACLELGKQLLSEILKNSVHITGTLRNEWYIPTMKEAGYEILADMVSEALTNPEEIHNNHEVFEGIAEILSAIQGKRVDVWETIHELKFFNPDVQKRFESEMNVITQQPQETVVTLSQEETRLIQKEQTKVKQMQQDFWSFVESAVQPASLVDLSSDLKILMQQYAKALSTVLRKYPQMLQSMGRDDMTFDPDMHIWETDAVAEAWNSDVVWNLLADPALISINKDDILRRTQVLEAFIQHPAFGSGPTA